MVVLAKTVHVGRREFGGDLNELIVKDKCAHACVEDDLAIRRSSDFKLKESIRIDRIGKAGFALIFAANRLWIVQFERYLVTFRIVCIFNLYFILIKCNFNIYTLFINYNCELRLVILIN